MEYKYHAIILSKINIAETDRIYTAYTLEAGKTRMFAKGVRKPNAKLAGNLEPLNYLEIFLAKSRGLGKITGVIGVDNFWRLKEKISSLEKVFYVLKIFDRLVTEEEKDENIFNLFFGYLKTMDKLDDRDEAKTNILTFGFVFKLLFLLGYGLEVKKCAVCGEALSSSQNYFSAPRGGTICGACSAREGIKVKISDQAVKFIRIFLENKIENLSKLRSEKKSLDNLKIVLNEAVGWIAG